MTISKASILKTPMSNMVEEYIEVSKKIKMLEDTKKMLSKKIKELTEKLGVKDDKGSFYYETDEYVTGKVAKKSISLDEDKAKELFKKKGFYDDVVKEVVVEEIDEDALEQKINEGMITEEEFNSICNVKVSYSVSVKEVAEMPEVEKSVLKAALKK